SHALALADFEQGREVQREGRLDFGIRFGIGDNFKTPGVGIETNLASLLGWQRVRQRIAAFDDAPLELRGEIAVLGDSRRLDPCAVGELASETRLLGGACTLHSAADITRLCRAGPPSAGFHTAPASLANRAASADPRIHGSPWPGSTSRMSAAASRSSDRN